MPKIIYVDFQGVERCHDVAIGLSVMEGAKKNNVPGIVAECGGNRACGTCHVYVDPSWFAKVGEPNDAEEDMLDAVFNTRENSRLSCQIRVTDGLNGLVVLTPENQF
jgi:2Fe-2S ferredoxin